MLLRLDLAARAQPHAHEQRAHRLAELGLRQQQEVLLAAAPARRAARSPAPSRSAAAPGRRRRPVTPRRRSRPFAAGSRTRPVRPRGGRPALVLPRPSTISVGIDAALPIESRGQGARGGLRPRPAAARPVLHREVAGPPRGRGAGRRHRDLDARADRRGRAAGHAQLRRARARCPRPRSRPTSTASPAGAASTRSFKGVHWRELAKLCQPEAERALRDRARRARLHRERAARGARGRATRSSSTRPTASR